MDPKLTKQGYQWAVDGIHDFPYGWAWAGVPVVQFPADIIRLQEIIWDTEPDLIIETGTKHGGSAIFFASMLRLLGNYGTVVTVDIRPQAEDGLLRSHSFAQDITVVTGGSTDPKSVKRVSDVVDGMKGAKVMVFLDSNHSATHVAIELKLYSPFVTPGCCLVVADGITEDVPLLKHKMNPAIAARAFLAAHPEFRTRSVTHEGVTYFKDGFLERLK